ncbi:phosphate-starvation-inducible PsiE family protein [Thermodesulfovibrio hydrogeniphilus]
MFDYLIKFKKLIIKVLTVMMAFVLLLSTVELGWLIIKDVITPPVFILDIEELLELFGFFMLVIIGIELLKTIMKTYLSESVDHVKVVMAVAIIAISRKVIILDVKEIPSLSLIGIGVIILGLTAGYYLIKRSK